LSYGGDKGDTTKPYEVQLGNYVNLDLPDSVIGLKALRDIHKSGSERPNLQNSLLTVVGSEETGMEPKTAMVVFLAADLKSVDTLSLYAKISARWQASGTRLRQRNSNIPNPAIGAFGRA